MASDIEPEPAPRLSARARPRLDVAEVGHLPLPVPKDLPDLAFADVLTARRSAVAGPVDDTDLGTLLWHVSRRLRGGPGRFGQSWEGRAAPSAGGIHIISILCIPMEPQATVGIYHVDRHAILQLQNPEELRRSNAESVDLLCSARAGTTLQFIADADRIADCYENSSTLLWRDSGALAATICLVATAMGLTSVVLGRIGHEILGQSGEMARFSAAGAVHLGALGE